MLIRCPSCNTEYNCEPGRYECECRTKFSVAEDGSFFDVSQHSQFENDKTIPPQQHNEADLSLGATLPGKRDRKPDRRFEVGDHILERYKVLSELGQGGMGIVYKCFDETAGIVIALKALPPELSHNTQEMEDIKDNFQLVHNLHHPNIAGYNTLERDQSNGNYYLIMECVEGEDLRHWIKRKRKEGPLTVETILPVIRQVATALDYAHEQKIIHRDIKPGNIMIDAAGHVKVLDFGLAAQIHTSMTRVSMAYHGTSGTAPYMAPEQWRGRAQGAAADQYALAVMTYELLAGHLPFESADVAVLQQVVLTQEPEPIKDISVQAQQALVRGMNKKSTERFDSCSEFAALLAGEHFFNNQQKKEGITEPPNTESTRRSKSDDKTTIKRICILMEQKDWDKAREYCERLLDSDPENPELYLLLCLIEHKVSNESMLLKCKCDLSEDKYFSTAIKFASAERKQQLIEIQSGLQQSMLHEYDFYINKCLEQNKVSDVSMLSKCKSPLGESIYFKMAFDCASPEQKKVLLHVQEEQNNKASATKRIWRNTKQMRRGGVLGAIIGLLLSPILGVSLYLSADERIHWPEEIPELLLVGIVFFIPVGLFLGISMEFLWEKCYKPKSKKMVLVWGTISGTLLCQIALILSVFITEVIDGKTSPISDKLSISGALIFGIPFGLFWSFKWFRKTNNKKDEIFRKIQDAQTEYTLWERKKNNTLSGDDEITLEEIVKKQKDEELQIAERKQLMKVGIAILVTILLFGVSVFVIMFLRRENEYQKGLSAYEEKDYATAAIHFRNAQEFGYTLDAERQTFLGTCYFFGTGIEKDYSKAIDLFWRNAQNSYSVAQYYLGICFYNGFGCVPDAEQAIRWLYRAAEQDVPVAKHELGKIYYKLKDEDNLAKQIDHLLPYTPSRNGIFITMSQSECVEEILSEAVNWFRKAAEQGLAEAQYYLGMCYENGEGIKKDLTEALKWYHQAAEQGYEEAINKLNASLEVKAQNGDMEAQFELGNKYYTGKDKPKDYTEAMKWFKKAAKQGHAEATSFLEPYIIVDFPDGTFLSMVKVEAGAFEMSKKDNKDLPKDNSGITFRSTTDIFTEGEVPHFATIRNDFYIGQTEVTQAQWKLVMGDNPSYFKGDNLPVEKISWNEAMVFCDKLNEMGKVPNGWKFTLPTETQWEFAALGGKKGNGFKYSGSNSLDEVAWYGGNSDLKTHPVGEKKANELELYDMTGNVTEWCLDDWYLKSNELVAEFARTNDPAIAAETIEEIDRRELMKILDHTPQMTSLPYARATRGSCWRDSVGEYLRVRFRNYARTYYRGNDVGFRLALVKTP